MVTIFSCCVVSKYVISLSKCLLYFAVVVLSLFAYGVSTFIRMNRYPYGKENKPALMQVNIRNTKSGES